MSFSFMYGGRKGFCNGLGFLFFCESERGFELGFREGLQERGFERVASERGFERGFKS